jgi:ribosome-associated protein
MLAVNDEIQVPEAEFEWSFARSGGPGGQNVNKVASKAILRWDLAASPSVPAHVKDRFRKLFRRRLTIDGEVVLAGQRYRDQERNRQDCLEKLAEMLRQAAAIPEIRRPTKPTKGSKRRRIEAKKRRSVTKGRRQAPGIEE